MHLPSGFADITALRQLSYRLYFTFKAVENGRNVAGQLQVVEELHRTSTILDSFKDEMRKPDQCYRERQFSEQSEGLGRELERIEAVLRDLESICSECITVCNAGSSGKGSRGVKGCCRARLVSNGTYKKKVDDIKELGQRLHKSIASLRSATLTEDVEEPFAEKFVPSITGAASEKHVRFAKHIESLDRNFVEGSFNYQKRSFRQGKQTRFGSQCRHPRNSDEFNDMAKLPDCRNIVHMESATLNESDLSDSRSESSDTVFSNDGTLLTEVESDDGSKSPDANPPTSPSHAQDDQQLHLSPTFQALDTAFTKLYPQYPIFREFLHALQATTRVNINNLGGFFLRCIEIMLRHGHYDIPSNASGENWTQPTAAHISQRDNLESIFRRLLLLDSGPDEASSPGGADRPTGAGDSSEDVIRDLTRLLEQSTPSRDDLLSAISTVRSEHHATAPARDNPTYNGRSSTSSPDSVYTSVSARLQEAIDAFSHLDPNYNFENDPELYVSDEDPCSYLERAIANNDLYAIDALIYLGANIEKLTRGESPLQFAIRQECPKSKTILHLLRKGAAVNLGGLAFKTPLEQMATNDDHTGLLLHTIEACIASDNMQRITGWYLPLKAKFKPDLPEKLAGVPEDEEGMLLLKAVRLGLITQKEHCEILRRSEKQGRTIAALRCLCRSIREDGSIDRARVPSLYTIIAKEDARASAGSGLGDSDSDEEDSSPIADFEFQYGV